MLEEEKAVFSASFLPPHAEVRCYVQPFTLASLDLFLFKLEYF